MNSDNDGWGDSTFVNNDNWSWDDWNSPRFPEFENIMRWDDSGALEALELSNRARALGLRNTPLKPDIFIEAIDWEAQPKLSREAAAAWEFVKKFKPDVEPRRGKSGRRNSKGFVPVEDGVVFPPLDQPPPPPTGWDFVEPVPELNHLSAWVGCHGNSMLFEQCLEAHRAKRREYERYQAKEQNAGRREEIKPAWQGNTGVWKAKVMNTGDSNNRGWPQGNVQQQPVAINNRNEQQSSRYWRRRW